MSELGDFLERFYRPEPTFRTVQGRIVHTEKQLPASVSAKKRSVIGRRNPHAKRQEESSVTRSVWAIAPDWVRVERTKTKNGQTKHTIEVVNDEGIWKRSADGSLEREERDSGRGAIGHALPTAYARHFDHRLIRECLAALTLEELGTCEVAGRECVGIRALPVPNMQLWPHWLAWEADEFEFAGDIERGVLLSIVGKASGEVSEQFVVESVSFDEDVDESLFRLDPEDEQSARPATPAVESVTLEVAAGRAPFTVLQPAWLPDSDRTQCQTTYHPARSASDSDSVTCHYHGGTSYYALWITQCGERDHKSRDDLLWETVHADGRAIEISDPSPEEGLKVVSFEQEGTWIAIYTDLPLEEIKKIAASFKPVS